MSRRCIKDPDARRAQRKAEKAAAKEGRRRRLTDLAVIAAGRERARAIERAAAEIVAGAGAEKTGDED